MKRESFNGYSNKHITSPNIGNTSKVFPQLQPSFSQDSLNKNRLTVSNNFSQNNQDIKTLKVANKTMPVAFTKSIGTIISSINKSFSTVFNNFVTQDTLQHEQLIETSKSKDFLSFYNKSSYSPSLLISPGKVPSDSFLPRLNSKNLLSAQKEEDNKCSSLRTSPSNILFPTTPPINGSSIETTKQCIKKDLSRENINREKVYRRKKYENDDSIESKEEPRKFDESQ